MKSTRAITGITALSAALGLLAACGDKVPESKAAKEIGNVPKQTIDKAATGVDKAITDAALRQRNDAGKQ